MVADWLEAILVGDVTHFKQLSIRSAKSVGALLHQNIVWAFPLERPLGRYGWSRSRITQRELVVVVADFGACQYRHLWEGNRCSDQQYQQNNLNGKYNKKWACCLMPQISELQYSQFSFRYCIYCFIGLKFELNWCIPFAVHVFYIKISATNSKQAYPSLETRPYETRNHRIALGEIEDYKMEFVTLPNYLQFATWIYKLYIHTLIYLHSMIIFVDTLNKNQMFQLQIYYIFYFWLK